MNNHSFQYGFHGVGHGLFWTGNLNGLNIVYDCGSSKMDFLAPSISNYTPQNIDILVISHFHKDHISGLKDLFSKKQCKTIFIPYVHPVELKFIELTYSMDLVCNNKEFSETDKNYLDFLSNPTDHLYKITHAENIITILPSEDHLNENYSTTPISYEGLSSIQTLPDTSVIKISSSYEKKHNWSLKFFNLPSDNKKKLTNYINELKDKKIETWKDLSNITSETLVSYIVLLEFIGKTIPSSLKNYTSLALSCIPHCSHIREKGIMLTGDLDLDTLQKQHFFSNHYQEELPQVAFFQYPHHGSNKNLPSTFPISNLPPDITWIISKKQAVKEDKIPDIIRDNNYDYEIVTEANSLVFLSSRSNSKICRFSTSPNDPNFYFPL